MVANDDVDSDGEGGTPPPMDPGDSGGGDSSDSWDDNTPDAPSLERSVTEPGTSELLDIVLPL